MIASLARVPLRRVTHTRRGLFSLAGWFVLAVVSAFVARESGASSADHALRGAFGVVVLPLLAYGIVSASLGGRGLKTAILGIVAIGEEPPRAAAITVTTAMLLSALACGVTAVVVCAIAHGAGDPPLARDLPASFGVAFVGGFAYAAYFSAGSAIGNGMVRGLFLALDVMLGAPAGAGAVLTPRGHVMSLLGGPLCFELSRRASSVVLVFMAIAYLGLAVQLGRRAR